MIYLIHNQDNNTLKIGKSNNPEKRLKQLMTATSDRLILLKTISGKDDNIFKNIYSKYHIIREWYIFSENIIDTFEKYEFDYIKILKNKIEKKIKFKTKLYIYSRIISFEAYFENEKDVLRLEKKINKLANKNFNCGQIVKLDNIEYNKICKKSLYFIK